jgi:hypothetical protein
MINDLRKLASRSFTLCLYSFVALSVVLISVKAHATQYYIDNSNVGSTCNDSGAGTSETAPWCDFTTFNSKTFNPGDTISLKSGDVWNQAVFLNGSGNSTSGAITLNSYGSGAQPKIEYGGSTAGTTVMSGTNISYWTINNLEIEDTSTVTFDPTLVTAPSIGVFLYYTGSSTYSHITLSNNTIHGTSTGHNNVLAYIDAYYPSGRSTDVLDYFTLANNTLYDAGIALFHQYGCPNSGCTEHMTYWTGGGFGYEQIYGNTAYDSDLQGIVLEAPLNSSIYDNLVHDTGLYTGSGAAWSPVALWSLGGYNTAFYNNEVYHSGDAGYADAGGIDVDWDNSYVTVQNNYLHDNTGPGVEVLSTDHTSVLYNRIYNNEQETADEPAQVALQDFAAQHTFGITDATIAHNVIVLSIYASRGLSTYGRSGATWSGNTFTNNYLQSVASDWAYDLELDGLGPMATMDYNKFYNASYFAGTIDGTTWDGLSNWQGNGYGFDAHSTTASDTDGVWQAWSDFTPPGHTNNQWSYQYSTNGESSFSAMTWTESTQSWNGSQAYCEITHGLSQAGDTTCDAVLTWTAPASGTAVINSDNIISVESGCGGSGASIRILKNGSQIWPSSGWQSIANGGNYTFPGVSTSVSTNDEVEFVVTHNGSNDYCDAVYWNPMVVL